MAPSAAAPQQPQSSSIRPAICPTVIMRTRAAASSIASGMPSASRTTSLPAPSSEPVAVNPGRTRFARSTKSSIAVSIPRTSTL